MESNGLKEILKPVNSATTPTTRNPQSFYQGKSIVPPMEKVGVSSAASSGTAANPATASAMPKSSQFLDNFLAAKAQRAKERERQKLDGVDKLKTEAEIRQKANDERRLKIKEDLEKVEKDQIQKAEADRLQKIEAEHLQKRLESDRRQAETDRLDSMDRFRKQLEENRRQAALDSSLDQMSLDGSDDGLVVPQNRQLGAASLQRSANNTFNNPDCKCKKSDLKAKGLSASRFAPSSPEDARPTHEGQFTHNSATSVHNKDCPYFEKFLDASEHGIRGEHVQALDKPRSARGLSPHAPSFVYAPTSITSMSMQPFSLGIGQRQCVACYLPTGSFYGNLITVISSPVRLANAEFNPGPGTTSSAQVTTNSAIFPDKYNGGLARSRWA